MPPVPSLPLPAPDATTEAAPNDQSDATSDSKPTPTNPSLSLGDVIASLYRSYPVILQARQEIRRTGGELISSYGAFDVKLRGDSLTEPTGFYENSRHSIGVARQTWWGGYLSAGYRIGRGDFQPWYKERETDRSGEFKIGLVQPLLQGRAIDPNRLSVFQASLARQAAEPTIQQAILESAREATELYWTWVAIGNELRAQRQLLELAQKRGQQYEAGVKAGKFAEIDLILNRQLIAERSGKVFEFVRKFRSIAFKLSLYLRDEAGQPMVADEAWLPALFPAIERPARRDLVQDLAESLARRPEPQILQFEIERNRYERQLARNNMLPSIDVVAEASQDLGTPASSADDKGEFLLIVGLQGEVPIQRRKARGKLQSTSAKIAQLVQKQRFVRDKIEAELRAAYMSLQLSSRVVEQAHLSLRAALESLDRYGFAFEKGKIDLIYLNLLETKATETEIKFIEAQSQWFATLARMQTALGLDPLEQAMLVDALPRAHNPASGQGTEQRSDESLERDWELHESPNR